MIIQFVVDELCICCWLPNKALDMLSQDCRNGRSSIGGIGQVSRNVLQEGITLHRRGVTEDLEALESAQSRALSNTPGGKGERSSLANVMCSDIDYSC
jgi:hypothetical protein